MAEFGHQGFIGGGMCIDIWGAGPFYITDDAGKQWRFEDSDRFGPSLLNKDGEISKRPWPAEGSPFWRAHRIWVRQGRRLEDEKNCIWDEPKPTIVRMITKRKALVVQNGEEDGKIVTLPPFFDVPSQDRQEG
jgi:hypothetical protein